MKTTLEMPKVDITESKIIRIEQSPRCCNRITRTTWLNLLNLSAMARWRFSTIGVIRQWIAGATGSASVPFLRLDWCKMCGKEGRTPFPSSTWAKTHASSVSPADPET